MIGSLPESLFLSHIFLFLDARYVQIIRWILAHSTTMRWSVPLDWTPFVVNDTHHLTPFTRRALYAYYQHNHPTPLPLSVVKRIYEPLRLPAHPQFSNSQVNVHDIGFYPSTFLPRGLCWSNNHSIHWLDTMTNETHTRQFEWLVLPPWELTVTHMFTMWLPSEHTHVPPYIISLVGQPEDTICLTNFKCLYQFSMLDDDPQCYRELTLGGQFESSITHLQLLHYTSPHLIVSGQPLWYNASRHYKCFGIWNIDTHTSMLPSIVTSCANFPPSAQARCGIPNVTDFLHYDCLCVTQCGQWVYWKFQHTLCCLHLPTQHVCCTLSFYPFTLGRVTQITVCMVKQCIGVYYGDEDVWKLFNMNQCLYAQNKNTIQPLCIFRHQHKTQLYIQPFRQQLTFWRKIGTKVMHSSMHY